MQTVKACDMTTDNLIKNVLTERKKSRHKKKKEKQQKEGQGRKKRCCMQTVKS